MVQPEVGVPVDDAAGEPSSTSPSPSAEEAEVQPAAEATPTAEATPSAELADPAAEPAAETDADDLAEPVEVDCSVELADEATAAAVAQECGHEVEVLDGRTEWNTVWAQPNGNMLVDVSMSAVRTQVDGDWAEIDTTVVAGEDGLEVASPVAEIVFSDGADGQPLARMVSEGHEITMDAPFDLTEPQVLGDSVLYPEVLPGVDLVVSVNADGTGFSEVLRIESAEAAANPALAELVFPIETTDGLAVTAEAGGFTAHDGAGETVFVSQAPAMWDSSAEQAEPARAELSGGAVARALDHVRGVAGGMRRAAERLESPVEGDAVEVVPATVAADAVSLAPDAEMLAAEDTVWPVYIDPPLSRSAPSERLAIRVGWPNDYNFVDSRGVGLCNPADPYGSSCPARYTGRVMYEFNSIPELTTFAPADVISATFSAVGSWSYSCTATNVQLYRVAPFDSTTTWESSSWLRLLQTHTIAHKPVCNNVRRVEFNATPAVTDLAAENQARPAGQRVDTLAFGLKAADESSMASWKRYEWDAHLWIEYNRPPTKPTNVRVANSMAVQQCTDGGTAYIGPNGAELSATLSDPDDGASLRGNFNVYETYPAATGVFEPEWTTFQAKDLSHSVTMPAKIGTEPQWLADGDQYVLTVDAMDQSGRWGPRTVCTLIADFTPPQAEPTVTPVAVPAGSTDKAWYVAGGEANGGVGVPGDFTFTYPQANDILGYWWALNDDSAKTWVAGASPTTTITPRGYGPQFLRVQAVDKAGNVGPAKVHDFVVARSGPASEWRFDLGAVNTTATDNTVVPDVSDALGDFSLTTWGSPTWTEGAANGPYPPGSDRALQFTGNARAVTPDAVVRTDESFTVMAMVRLDELPTVMSGGREVARPATAVSQDGGALAGFSLGYHPSQSCGSGTRGCWSFLMYGDGADPASLTAVQSTDVPAEADQWVQLAGIYDAVADEARLMVCTVPAATDSHVLVSDDSVPFTPSWNADGKLRVGMAMEGSSMVRQFPGDISGVRVYAGVADDADFSRACSKGYWDMPLDPTGEDVDTALPEQSVPAESTDAPVSDMADATTTEPIWTAGGLHTVVAGREPSGTTAVPVSLVTEDDAAVGEPATIELLDHAAALEAGVTGLLFEVTPAPASTDLQAAMAAGELEIAVDTSAFASAYGGGYAERLRVVEVPACATTDQAAQPQCQIQTPIATTTDPETGHLKATLAASTSGTYAVTAGVAGSTGDWSATSLAASASWEVAAQSGNFSWSYPMRVPPGINGPAPDISLDYSSGSIDGRVSSTNNQSSWIGDGWDLTTGYIERRYVSCSDEKDAPANNAGEDETGDLCWKTDNATMMLGGQSRELVKISEDPADGSSVWRAIDDDGTRIERLLDAANGDNDGEFWVVTTPDGTQYTFGREYRGADTPSGQPNDPHNLGSAWTVPVYSNHDGEGGDYLGAHCHKTEFADSRCPQAWRWNLDYVKDTSGNSMTYWYTEEGNSYTSNYTATSDGEVVQYVRGGYLHRIDYGQHADTLEGAATNSTETGTTEESTAPAWVEFTTTERCDDCGDGEVPTADNAIKWPDVPVDLICTSATSCPTVATPAFFTRVKLSAISTYVRDAGGSRPVDTWTLTQTFPDPGDATDPSLWLKNVQHTGRAGDTEIQLPAVQFTGEPMDNRVDRQLDAGPPMKHYRLTSITDESGGAISIDYTEQQCTSANTAALVPADNTLLCFPVYWTPERAEDPILEYFHKYLVTSIVQNPRVQDSLDTVSQNIVTHYDYGAGADTGVGETSTPAWRYNDDPFTPLEERTYSDFAGYSSVAVITGDSDDAADANARSMVEYHYYRGLHRAEGTEAPRSVQVNGVDDIEPLAGFAWKTRTYNGATIDPEDGYVPGPLVSWTVSEPWVKTLATTLGPVPTMAVGLDGTPTFAVRVAATETHTVAPGATGGEVVTRTDTVYHPVTALPVWIDDQGDMAPSPDPDAVDDLCTHVSYVANDAATIAKASETRTSAGPCPSLVRDDAEQWGTYESRLLTEFNTLTAVSGSRALYDGHATHTAELTRGLVTETQVLTEDGFVRQSTMSFDDNARPVASGDALDRTTTTTYSASVAGGPVTSMKVTTPQATSDSATTQETTTVLDPAWGKPVVVTDTNGKITSATYDALGRITKVWFPGRSQVLQQSPNLKFTYTLNAATGVTAVTTESLAIDGKTYNTSVQLYDGLLRPRQTQAPSAARDTAGRIVTDTYYDSRGQVAETTGAWFTTGSPGTTVVTPTLTTVVPSTITKTYDGVGRPLVEAFHVGITEQWRTTYAYAGDRVTVDPPSGGTATTTVSDARGRAVSLQQYLSSDPTGPAQATTYTYDLAGHLVGMEDAAGNEWSYTYDMRGRQLTATDPDKGTTTTTYDAANQVLTTKDQRDEVLAYEYDGLGRKTGLWSGQVGAGGTQLASWQYDTRAEGQLTSSTRYDDGKAYTVAVTGYDDGYRPLGQEVTIPASEPGVGGTYPTTFTYAPNGAPETVTLPAIANLPEETLTTVYDKVDLPRWLVGTSGTYVADSLYSAYGEPLQYDLGNTYSATVTYSYAEGTRRLNRAWLWAEGHQGYPMDVTYTYDPAGNPLSAVDNPAGPDIYTQCYAYDGLRRLTNAWTPQSGVCATGPSAIPNTPASYAFTDTFDAIGNRTGRTETDAADAQSVTTYTYDTSAAPDSPGPHQLLGMTTTGATPGTGSFTYDATGNTITRDPVDRDPQTLTWDAEGRLSAVDGTGTDDASFVYTADGDRLIRREAGTTTVYLPGGQELTYTTDTGVKAGTRYYYFNGQTVAVRTGPGHGDVTTLVSDPHGTAQIAVDNADNQLTRRYFDPYGQPLTDGTDWAGDHGFLDKPTDDTGLTHIGARYYDPTTGRFISVDPIMDLSDPQQWQGYAYANNNPITYSDPSGLAPRVDDGGQQGYQRANDAGTQVANMPPPPPPLTEQFQGLQDEDDYVAYVALFDDTSREEALRHMDDGTWKLIGDRAATYRDIIWACSHYDTPCAPPCPDAACDAKRAGEFILWEIIGFVTGVGTVAVLGKAATADARAAHAASMVDDAARVADDVADCATGACGVPGGTCFVEGTLIRTERGDVPIEDVRVGDRVWSRNLLTGEDELRPVVETYVRQAEALLALTVAGAVLTTTADHPFMVSGRGWVVAGALVVGDVLVTPTGTALLEAIEHEAEGATVYNFQVATTHTYYAVAGGTAVLVHNANYSAAVDDWANVSGILRDASRGKGNFGVGTGTAAEAQAAGRAWVGSGARPASDGFGGWVSSDGLRMWRPPSYKPEMGRWQSNFQWRNSLNQTWQGNGHLDITDLP